MVEQTVINNQQELAEFQNNLVFAEIKKYGYSIVDLELKKIKLDVQLQRFGLFKTRTIIFLKINGQEDKKLCSYITETRGDNKFLVTNFTHN